MKKLYSLLITGMSLAALWAQAPSKFSYQAVVRNSSGTVVPSGTNVSFRFTIRDGSAGGTILYQETQSKTTNNAFGLVNLEIGAGTVAQGSYPSAAQWASGSKFLQVEVDPAGGTSYADLGATQLSSVPYANFAGSSGSLTGSVSPSQIGSGGASNGQVLQWNGSNWVPATLSGGGGGDITSVTAGTGLSGGGTSGDVTLNATNSTAMWNADKIQGIGVTAGASNGQVLKFNGTNWAAASDDNTTYSAGTGLSLAGTTLNSVWTASGNNIYNNNSGNLGIGTTNPQDKFHLRGTNSIGRFEFANNGSWISFYKNNTYLGYLGNYNDSNSLAFGTNNNGPNDNVYLVTKATPRLTVTSDGKIGFGTTTPTFMHQIYTPNTTYAISHYTSQTTGATSSDGLMIGHNVHNGEAILWNWENQDLFFGTNASERMRILKSGEVGIGTSNPVSPLHVDGTMSSSYSGVVNHVNNSTSNLSFATMNSGGGSGSYSSATYVGDWATVSGGSGQGWGQYSSVSNSSTNYGVYGYATGGSTNYSIYCAGNGVYTGTWSSSSDAKLKKDINSLEGGLSAVMKLKPSIYSYRTNEPAYKTMNLATGTHYGFIAQELEQVLPDLVSKNYHSTPENPENVVEYKAVNYTELIPVLTKAIQEQQAQIESLKKEVEALKAAQK